MLKYDPIPWLMAQEGLRAVRARRRLGLERDGDKQTAQAHLSTLYDEQAQDGSFEHSLMRTAGTLSLMADLQLDDANELIERGALYLLDTLEAQPGYKQAHTIMPGSLTTPCDLGGFFGPYDARSTPEAMERGAAEMNIYREFAPLSGPQSPVRGTPRSSRDRAGPSSCYAWGLIPLCYTIEALCRTGYAHHPRLTPALQVFLGVQRKSGNWCRNSGGHPNCTLHALGVLGAHPDLRKGTFAQRTLERMRETQTEIRSWWKGTHQFAMLSALARFDLPPTLEQAQPIIQDLLTDIAPKQQRSGSLGKSHPIERAAAVIAASRLL